MNRVLLRAKQPPGHPPWLVWVPFIGFVGSESNDDHLRTSATLGSVCVGLLESALCVKNVSIPFLEASALFPPPKFDPPHPSSCETTVRRQTRSVAQELAARSRSRTAAGRRQSGFQQPQLRDGVRSAGARKEHADKGLMARPRFPQSFPHSQPSTDQRLERNTAIARCGWIPVA